jgi:hypothetical protein
MIRFLLLRAWCSLSGHPTTEQELEYQTVHWCRCGREFEFRPYTSQER